MASEDAFEQIKDEHSRVPQSEGASEVQADDIHPRARGLFLESAHSTSTVLFVLDLVVTRKADDRRYRERVLFVQKRVLEGDHCEAKIWRKSGAGSVGRYPE